MCLGTKLSDRSLARYKAKGKKTGYIRVWKVVEKEKRRRRYSPEYYPEMGRYIAGLNTARTDARLENHLIHAFRDRHSAEQWRGYNQIIISTMVHPDWVKAIGKDDYDKKLTLTTKAIVMPAYPKRRVTVAEFRKAIKGKKVKVYSWE